MNSICVYCGSSMGHSPLYRQQIELLGMSMAQQGLSLVYGGASIGLMGALADTVLHHGGKVIGVIPKVLVEKEVVHHHLSQLHIVQSMHERKALMADLADAFIAFPGGFGTLDELFEILTWMQLGIHSKPVGLLNVNGYFDLLIKFLEQTLEQGFVKTMHSQHLLIGRDQNELIEKMREFQAPSHPKWLQRENI